MLAQIKPITVNSITVIFLLKHGKRLLVNKTR